MPLAGAEASSPRAAAVEPSGPPAGAVPLTRIPPGSTARVEGVDADAALAGRLLDLGFLPGTPVRVLRRAPLGDPTVYELRGYRVCLRHGEGACIRVSPD